MLRMAGPLAVRLTDRIVKMLIDLSFILVVLVTVLSLSQTTSDAHAQWRRLRKPSTHDANALHVKVKRQIPAPGNMLPPSAGGIQGPAMGGMPAPPAGVMLAPGPPGGPPFMGPPGMGMQQEFSCVGRLPRLYQDPWMCSRYYWCNYGSPPVPFTCPNGQLFDQELQTCTAALAVECRDFPEPLDALDMPAGGIGYHGHPHGSFGMNASPYGPPGGMGAVPVPNGVAGPIGSAGPIQVANAAPPNAVPQTNAAAIMPPVGAASNSGPMMPGASNGLNGLTGNAAQPASLQAGNALSGNINLNQFAQAILSANSANKAQQAFLRSAANPDPHMGMANGTPDLTGACDGAKTGVLMADVARNCRNYYFCSQDGMKFEFPCPAGMLFSDQLRSCTSPDQVICMETQSFGSTTNQVLNGFAAANAARNNVGYAGVLSSQGEPVALRYPQINSVSTNAIYSLPSGKRQAISGLPDFTPLFQGYPNTQVQTNYNPYAMTRQAVVTQPVMTGAAGSNPSLYNPYLVTQLGGGTYGQMPHHVTQRSMHTSGSGNSVPHYNTQGSYPYQATDPNQYPSQAVYPNSYHHSRQNPAIVSSEGNGRSWMSAEPQIEGSPSYPAQMPPSYYPSSGQSPNVPGYPNSMVASQGGGYPPGGGGMHHGHIQLGVGGRNRPRMPIDPEAEVEAGRAHETPPAGGSGGAAGGAGGQGIPAGLSAPGGHQSPVGPMMMEPETVIPSAVPSPSVREGGGAINMSGFAQVIIDRPDVIATSVTIRPMTPDIIVRVHLDNASFPLLSSHNPAEAGQHAVYHVRRNHSAKHLDHNTVFSIPDNAEFTVPPK
ncbi:uncharacterized protein LOC129591469 isoform X2 [Paramacrobiotus metropolitanus]|uniref:uncharacterized protein LOC129591469 isoform X2 n=1 Tax=Paramacrobiotus metropolitanus TaxID=2943436 RepID=UPI0024464EB1|nr:uncharacterized protein LOC129591469 isoform X2 [Paramacrobiotus metropolitanus]